MTHYPDIRNIPPGTYKTKVEHLQFGPAKSTGNLRVFMAMTIIGTPHAGKQIPKVQMLTTDLARKHCVREWQKVGIALNAPDDLKSFLPLIRESIFEVQVVHGTNPACYFLRRVSASEQECQAGVMSFEAHQDASPHGR